MKLNGKMDLHNHTRLSDGHDTAEEIVINAIKNGVNHIGISDHFEVRYSNLSRLNLSGYISSIGRLKKQYKDQINVLCGIEMLVDSEQIEKDIPFEELNLVDYILFEHLDYFDGADFFKFLSWTENFTCKLGLAHTDLFTLFEIYGEKNVLEGLKKRKIFWELNVSYTYYMDLKMNASSLPYRNLINRLKENKILITVGSDTHSLEGYDKKEINFANKIASITQ